MHSGFGLLYVSVDVEMNCNLWPADQCGKMRPQLTYMFEEIIIHIDNYYQLRRGRKSFLNTKDEAYEIERRKERSHIHCGGDPH